MTTNWPTFLLDNTRLPETAVEAVDRLMVVLESEHKVAIATTQEDDLIDLHFSLGMAIRNAFGLYEPQSQLLASCGVVHPDDTSGVLIKKLWLKIKHEIHHKWNSLIH
ncbi:MAG: DUF6794 domain-containing protein [Methylococcaceae bacterium]